jgi:hypothetical protein
VDVAEGTVHVVLGLGAPDQLLPNEAGPWDGARVLNRYVRPLLRALTRPTAIAHYFGRDWVSLARRPVASVGFAHLVETGHTVVEAWVGVHAPFASYPRPSYRGAEPASLDTLTGDVEDPRALAARIDGSFRRAFPVLQQVPCAPEATQLPRAALARFGSTPWNAASPAETIYAQCTFEEALGPVTVARTVSGAVQMSGEIMVSLDAWHACEQLLESSIRAGTPPDAAIEETLGHPGVLMFGWRSFDALKDAVRGLDAARGLRSP